MQMKSVHSREIEAAPGAARIANAAEIWPARRNRTRPPADGTSIGRVARACGVAVPALLTAIAALHARWALGSPWPAASERQLAEAVLSSSERDKLDGGLPPAPATWLVAVALLAAAGTVRTAAAGTHSRALRGAAWGVSAVLLARGVAYIPSDLNGGLDDNYQRLDLTIYSPLCLALGAATALVARCASGSRPLEGEAAGPAASSPISQGAGGPDRVASRSRGDAGAARFDDSRLRRGLPYRCHDLVDCLVRWS